MSPAFVHVREEPHDFHLLLQVDNLMGRDTVAHVLFPDKEIIDGAPWAVVARHGHTFAVDKLVRMAGQEGDKAAAIELFPVHCHGELVRASVDDYAIHIFSP